MKLYTVIKGGVKYYFYGFIDPISWVINPVVGFSVPEFPKGFFPNSFNPREASESEVQEFIELANVRGAEKGALVQCIQGDSERLALYVFQHSGEFIFHPSNRITPLEGSCFNISTGEYISGDCPLSHCVLVRDTSIIEIYSRLKTV